MLESASPLETESAIPPRSKPSKRLVIDERSIPSRRLPPPEAAASPEPLLSAGAPESRLRPERTELIPSAEPAF